MMICRWIFFSVLVLTVCGELSGQTIAEKKASFQGGGSGDLSKEMQRFLLQVNTELKEQQELLRDLYKEVRELYDADASEGDYKELLDSVNAVKQNVIILEDSWREMAAENNQQEEYALWHQPDTTLQDLVIDYGSQDYVYLVPSDIAERSLSVNSNIPIPRSSWNEMLEIILRENGIGVRQLNPYLRMLYDLKEDNSSILLITNKRADLNIYPGDARICFVLSPDPSQIRRIWFFLEKFVNPNTTEVQMIGRDILIISQVSAIRELLKLYDFVESNSGTIDYRIVALHRVDAEEMGKILSSIFEQFVEEVSTESTDDDGEGRRRRRSSTADSRNANGLRVITLAHLAQAIFLIGTPEEITKAEEIIYQVESSVGEARAKVVYTYNTKYTDTVELADILEKVYNMMIQTGAGLADESDDDIQDIKQEVVVNEGEPFIPDLPPPAEVYNPAYNQAPGYYINPIPVVPGMTQQGHPHPNRGRHNFIVDPKTGTIVMVVEAIALPKLKEVIKKLDVPKKMVQIDVLLFEKNVDKQSIFGLNLLKIGDCASGVNDTCFNYNDGHTGIVNFLLSRACGHGIAAYDLAYRFLLSRDDVTINANPSVVAVNQTTAMIQVNEEISVNVGTLFVPTTAGSVPENQFQRLQYGITIKVTPTINMKDDEAYDFGDMTNYITLDTDLTFDTPFPSENDRPKVIRRHIQNNVRIADGQTVILGGLRRKTSDDRKTSIPFLGELPGIGKLFSDTVMVDEEREMYIFLTPKIISDPVEDMDRIRCEELCKRPGDIPAFLCRLDRARECEKNRILEGYLTLVLGRRPPNCYQTGEYDGRCRR